jgi:PilZ domain
MLDTSEPRFNVDLMIHVFGMDADSRPFSQQAQAQNISDHGAKLSGLEKRLTVGEIIGVHVGDKKARFKVMWVAGGPGQKMEVAVKMLEGQVSPWQKERETLRATSANPISRTKQPAKDKRKYPRHRISFPIEIRDETIGSLMGTKTADIGGQGCYVETMVPFPLKKAVTVTFWLNSRRVKTTAIVRTSDGGVGMGIEFTGLEEATQKQLQQHLGNLAMEGAPFKKARGAP